MSAAARRLRCPPALAGQAGFTVMELLMASFIGTMVLGTMWGAVAVQGRGAATQMGLADAQLASRGAGEVLLQDLRMAGFGMLGVSPDEDVPPIEVESVGAVTRITLRGAYTNTQTTLAISTPAGSSTLTVLPPAEGAFAVDQMVLVDSGLNSEVRTISSVSASGANLEIGLSAPVNFQYPLGPNVTQIEEVEYEYDGAVLRRNDEVLIDSAGIFDMQYVDQNGDITPEPADDLRSVLLDLEAAQSSNLPGNPYAHAAVDTEVNVRNLAFRASLD